MNHPSVRPRPLVSRLTLSLTLGLSLLAAACTHAADAPAGFVDFGTFNPPADGSQFVDVQVNTALLSIAARVAEKQEPEVADLLRSLKSVRVHVIGLTDANRAELGERVTKLRTELDSKGWNRVVSVQEAKQEVGVYVKQRTDEAIEGIVVTVIQGQKEAVLVNVVGDIKPDQIAVLGDRLNIDPLKKAGRAIKKSGA